MIARYNKYRKRERDLYNRENLEHEKRPYWVRPFENWFSSFLRIFRLFYPVNGQVHNHHLQVQLLLLYRLLQDLSC
jgi:hypothetical protein